MRLWRDFFKSCFDRILALILLIFAFPILLFVMVAIGVSLGRPVFFQQQRPGKDEKIFTIFKFRTMSNERDENGELLPDAQRLKGIGKLVRSLSLDELPQLLNVLKGEMSFIGPRPLLIEYLPRYNTIQKRRHEVNPGITGWAQVNGRNAITWEEKFNYDVWYVDNISFWLDMKIILMTVQKVFQREGISQQGHATMEKFMGSPEKEENK